MTSNKSLVWDHFIKKGKSEAICNTCQTIIQRSSSNTTGMINHLKIHKISLLKTKNDDLIDAASKKSKMDSSGILKFVSRETLEEILAKCAAKSGFSIKGIVSSEAITGFIQSRGYTMPKSETTVIKYVMKFYEDKKAEMKVALLLQIKSGNRFSITVDEWSDINMRRYINVTLHSSVRAYVLGLVPIIGSCDSDATISLVTQKLKEFGINLDSDIVASTNDGAAVMVKYGRNIAAACQLCINHGIHLGVIDVFYKKNMNIIEVETNDEDEDAEYEDDDDDIPDNNKFAVDGNLNFEVENLNELPQIRADIGIVLGETRKIIKFFKRSCVRSCILQKHVLEQEGTKLRLLLDCRTRWNSIIPMVNRFLKLINCINFALEELGKEKFREENIIILKGISEVLQPVELAVNELSKEDSNLLKAEGVCIFLMNKLQDANKDIATELKIALKRRIDERRQKDLISLMLFLQTGTYPQSNEHFSYSSKNIIKSSAKEYFKRLFNCGDEGENSQEEDDDSDSQSDMTMEHSAYDELQKTIMSVMKVPKVSYSKLLLLERELKLFNCDQCKRGEHMEKLYQALLTIPPTSTASERVFSVASNFITKLRSQMKTNTLNGLVFLKYYFLSNK